MNSKHKLLLPRSVLVALIGLWVPGLSSADDAWLEESPFDLTVEEFTAGVRQHGLDEGTEVMGWQLSDHLYFGRRHGQVDDFGFILERGDTQFSLTQDGIGWRRSISLFR